MVDHLSPQAKRCRNGRPAHSVGARVVRVGSDYNPWITQVSAASAPVR